MGEVFSVLFPFVVTQGFLAVVGALLYYLWRMKAEEPAPFRFYTDWHFYAWTLVAILTTTLSYYATQWLVAHFGWSCEPQNVVKLFRSLKEPVARVVLIGMIVCVAPIAEEWFFRWVVFRRCVAVVGTVVSVVLSSLFFALFHGNLLASPGLFVLGLFLAVTVVRWRSFWATVSLHAAFNVMSVGVNLYAAYA